MADAVLPTDHTFLLAEHPSNDYTPRAFLAVHDPTTPADYRERHDVPCWVALCKCEGTFPLRPVDPERIVDASRRNAASQRASGRTAPESGTPRSPHPRDTHSGSQSPKARGGAISQGSGSPRGEGR